MRNATQNQDPLQAAAEIAQATASILNTDEVLQTAVRHVAQIFDLDDVKIFLLDENNTAAVLRVENGSLKLKKKKFNLSEQSPVSWCVNSGQPWTSNNKTGTLLAQARSEMIVALTGRKTIIGALSLHSRVENAFSEKQQKLAQSIARQLAISIENTYLFAESAASQRVAEDLLHETIALQQLSQALSGTLSIEQIVEIFFQTCTKMLGFDFVIFSLVDSKKQCVKAIAGAGVSEEHIKRANHALNSNDIMADIIRTGHTELVSGWDDRFDKTMYETEQISEWGLRVFTPIRLRQENIGLVEIGYNKNTQEEIHDSQIRLLRAFIDQTALALDNAQRHQASQRAIRREALIKDITTKVRGSTNVDTILQIAVKEIGDALHSKRTQVHLISPGSNTPPAGRREESV